MIYQGIISGGIINAGGYMLVSAFKTSSANTNVTHDLRFRKGLGMLGQVNNTTTSGKWV